MRLVITDRPPRIQQLVANARTYGERGAALKESAKEHFRLGKIALVGAIVFDAIGVTQHNPLEVVTGSLFAIAAGYAGWQACKDQIAGETLQALPENVREMPVPSAEKQTA